MKFREYNNLKSKILTAIDPDYLTTLVDNFGENFDIIDLQYSTHKESNGHNFYSVFILYKER